MSNWYYDIVETTDTITGNPIFSLHEHYVLNGETLWTEEPTQFVEESVEDLIKSLGNALHDLKAKQQNGIPSHDKELPQETAGIPRDVA